MQVIIVKIATILDQTQKVFLWTRPTVNHTCYVNSKYLKLLHTFQNTIQHCFANKPTVLGLLALSITFSAWGCSQMTWLGAWIFSITFPACFSIPIFFSNLNYNCSNLLDMRNLQEQVKKAFCYQKLFWPFTVWINCSSNLQNFAKVFLDH